MARKKKILVVDDERDLVDLIGMNLLRHHPSSLNNRINTNVANI